MMKLFLVHCGFYDPSVCEAQYEFHVNYFVVASDVERAKLAAKEIPEFTAKRMHIDGLQEIEAVGGYKLRLEERADLKAQTLIHGLKYRELAPKAIPAD